MQRFIYKFSGFISVIAFISALVNGVSMQTSLIRAGLVFFGIMILFIVSLNVMRWVIISTTVIERHEEKEKAEEHQKSEKEKLASAKTDKELLGERA